MAAGCTPPCDLGDAAASTELLALLDGRPCGRLAPMLRAERDLARARLAAADGDPGAAAAFTAAVTGLRELSTPYHLAHGLLDHAGYLIRTGDAQTAAAAIQDADGIATRLGCQPLLDRAADLMPAQPARPPDPVQATRHLLAHALLDHAAHLAARGDTEATAAAIGEAADIAQRLGCQPLMDRAETTQTARPRTAAS